MILEDINQIDQYLKLDDCSTHSPRSSSQESYQQFEKIGFDSQTLQGISRQQQQQLFNLDQEDSQLNSSSPEPIFQIIRNAERHSNNNDHEKKEKRKQVLQQFMEFKLKQKRKRIFKRQQAKMRQQMKALAEISNSDDSSAESKLLNQKIKNRLSAQISRDKKKEYVKNLEKENRILKLENQKLMQELNKHKTFCTLNVNNQKSLQQPLQNQRIQQNFQQKNSEAIELKQQQSQQQGHFWEQLNNNNVNFINYQDSSQQHFGQQSNKIQTNQSISTQQQGIRWQKRYLFFTGIPIIILIAFILQIDAAYENKMIISTNQIFNKAADGISNQYNQYSNMLSEVYQDNFNFKMMNFSAETFIDYLEYTPYQNFMNYYNEYQEYFNELNEILLEDSLNETFLSTNDTENFLKYRKLLQTKLKQKLQQQQNQTNSKMSKLLNLFKSGFRQCQLSLKKLFYKKQKKQYKFVDPQKYRSANNNRSQENIQSSEIQ